MNKTNTNKKLPGKDAMKKLDNATCKQIAAKVASEHKGLQKPQLLHRKPTETDPNKILLKDYQGKKIDIAKKLIVKWVSGDEPYCWRRQVKEVTFSCDFTKLNHIPTKADVERELREDLRDIEAAGWSLCEEDAYGELLRDIERVLGHAMIELEYSKPCKCCLHVRVANLHFTMNEARMWMKNLDELRRSVDGKWPVIPDLAKFEIKDRKFVPLPPPKKGCCCGGKSCKCKKGKK